MVWSGLGEWRWRGADCFDSSLEIKRLDLVAVFKAGMKTREKPKVTAEFPGLSHWPNSRATD